MKRFSSFVLAVVASLCATAHAAAPTGAINGLFSVAADKQVYFSQGNLQCSGVYATTYTWSFAEHQYDRLGTANIDKVTLSGSGKVLYSLATTIDLFGWSSDNATSDFGINASNLSSDYEGNFVDWGTNAITNGGNVSNLWRTPTSAEWSYLFETRANAANLHAEATVNGVAGTVLLPDAFVLPTGSTFTPSSTNTYTTAQWTTMETAGAVFLPNTGTREGTTVEAELVDEVGVYWSATSTTTTGGLQGSALEIWGSSITYSPYPFPVGLAVRLVSDYQTYTITVETPSHGTLTADKSQAGDGETVTLTAVPDTDYELQGVSVLQGTTAVSYKADASQAGVYTFTMPAGAVVVTATFSHKPDYRPQPISVSDTKQVLFSRGNLQCARSTDPVTWDFAAHQYDMQGAKNIVSKRDPLKGGITKYLGSTIDLFGWSSDRTGNNFGVTTSTDASYFASDEFLDWGENVIGTDAANTWQTLTSDEWAYIFLSRTNAEQSFGFGTVNGVLGVILLPDVWTQPTGVAFYSAAAKNIPLKDEADGYENAAADNFTHNTYTIDEWVLMESHGAVFLPSAGLRNGTTLSGLNAKGLYWSATPHPTSDAICFEFTNSELLPNLSAARCVGGAVRLVQEYDPSTITGEQAATLSDPLPVRKEIRNGQVFIIRGDQVLTILGQPIK